MLVLVFIFFNNVDYSIKLKLFNTIKNNNYNYIPNKQDKKYQYTEATIIE